jgi:N-methylhydantoinase A/acetophenone carboxylase
MRLALELELRYGSSPVTQRIRCKTLRLEGEEDVKELYRDFRAHLMNLSFGVDLPEAPVRIETFALKGSIPTVREAGNDQNSMDDKEVGKQPKSPPGERGVIWDSSLTRVKTPVFLIEDLTEGDLIVGPAIGEAMDTTYVIPPGWELSVLRGAVCELRTHT